MISLLLSQISFAQKNEPSSSQISLGYLGQIAYHPGAKISASFYLRNWEKEKGTKEKLNQLYVQPGIGFYIRSNYNTNLIVGSEVGIKRQYVSKKTYRKYCVGINYILRSEIMSLTVDFDGKTIAKERETRHIIAPTLGYEYGYNFNDKLSLFTKITTGYRFSINQPNSINTYFEAGINLTL